MNEIWKDVVGYEEEYKISNLGNVMSLKKKEKPQILKTFLSHWGYVRINLMKQGKMKQVFVHRLVAQSFLGEIKDGMVVNHIDGNKTNNNLNNLEIVTQSENCYHSHYALGNGIIAILMLDKNTYEILREFPSIKKASQELDIDETSIYRVCANERNYAGGYSWVFKEEYNQQTLEKKQEKLKLKYYKRPVYQIDPKTNKIINSFDSIKEAEITLGLSNIRQCVTGRNQSAGGFLWKYKTEEMV